MYSQSLEQKFILEAFEIDGGRAGVNYSRGAFLDVGAFAPKTFSNTRALYELGWSGVMIEPSPMPMHALLQEYGKEPRITLICAAVGLERQMAKLNITQDAMSTSDPAWCEKWAKDGGYYGSMFVPQITLDDIFLQFGGGFDFVNIDTEGSSFELLKALLATEVRPRCIAFEHDGRHAESFALFDACGYKMVYENDENRILVLK